MSVGQSFGQGVSERGSRKRRGVVAAMFFGEMRGIVYFVTS